MQSEYVVLTKEEYKELLIATLRKEIELEARTMFEDELDDLHEALEDARGVSTYWFNHAKALEEELKQLKAKMEGGEAN